MKVCLQYEKGDVLTMSNLNRDGDTVEVISPDGHGPDSDGEHWVVTTNCVHVGRSRHGLGGEHGFYAHVDHLTPFPNITVPEFTSIEEAEQWLAQLT